MLGHRSKLLVVATAFLEASHNNCGPLMSLPQQQGAAVAVPGGARPSSDDVQCLVLTARCTSII